MLFAIDASDPEVVRLDLVRESVIGHQFQTNHNLSEILLVEIKKFLRRQKISLQQIEKLAVVVGPGPFSRVRTAVATANALAYALEIPIVGVRSLGQNINWQKVAKKSGVNQVAAFYDRPPNITKAKKRV